MKTKFLLLTFFFFPVFLFAQEEVDQSVYLFDNFENGFAVIKGGQTSGLFNYDVVSGRILFKDKDGAALNLNASDDISYVNIGNHTFVHIKGDTYYENIPAGDGNLFVYWKYKIISKGKEIGYGATSQTMSVGNLSLIDLSLSQIEQPGGGVQMLKSSEQFKVVNQNNYYLFRDGKYRIFTSVKSFAKLFGKNNEGKILTYAQDEKIDFKKLDDLKKLVSFSTQFEK